MIGSSVDDSRSNIATVTDICDSLVMHSLLLLWHQMLLMLLKELMMLMLLRVGRKSRDTHRILLHMLLLLLLHGLLLLWLL